MTDVHEDLDQPGSRADRPGLLRAMEQIRSGEVAGIVVWRLDRFGRSAVDNTRLLEEIRSHGAALYTIAEGIDTSSGAMGEFMATVFSAFAKLELERIRENWLTARSRAVERGIHVASRTPVGYERGEGRVLRPSGPAAAVRRVFEARARGKSWRECGLILEAAGVETVHGNPWSTRALQHVIANRVYLGEARSGELVNATAHEPIVDELTWQRAQRARGERYSPKGGALLSGLLRCAGCRFTMKADFQPSRSGEKLRVYRCRRRDCTSRSAVLGRVIEPWVEAAFFERVGALRVRGVPVADELAETVAERDLARERVIRFRDLEDVLGEHYAEGLQALTTRLSAAEERLLEVGAQAELVPLLADLEAEWLGMAIPERRRVLSGEIQVVFLRSVGMVNVPIGERALILWRGEGPDGLPGVGTRGIRPRPFEW